jgi:hypothetical protein
MHRLMHAMCPILQAALVSSSPAGFSGNASAAMAGRGSSLPLGPLQLLGLAGYQDVESIVGRDSFSLKVGARQQWGRPVLVLLVLVLCQCSVTVV